MIKFISFNVFLNSMFICLFTDCLMSMETSFNLGTILSMLSLMVFYLLKIEFREMFPAIKLKNILLTCEKSSYYCSIAKSTPISSKCELSIIRFFVKNKKLSNFSSKLLLLAYKTFNVAVMISCAKFLKILPDVHLFSFSKISTAFTTESK